MEKRQLDNLILNDEVKVLIGDYTIDGTVNIKNSELIVFGNLTILDDVTMENSELIVSGSLNITDFCYTISIIATDISVGQLTIFDIQGTIFSITDGDIFVAGKLFSEIKISSNSDITVLGELEIEDDISCLNLFVGGFADCCAVDAILDIYCLLGINSQDLSARDIYTESSINCNNSMIQINGQIYAPAGISNCASLFFGR